MTPKELLTHCANALDMNFPALNCVTIVHPRGAGRFPFSGRGVELLNEQVGRRVYSVDIELVLTFLARAIKEERKRATEQWEQSQRTAVEQSS